MSSTKVFVSGATGIQGGAVTNHLLANGFTVKTTVRDSTSAASKALQARGVYIVAGTWDDIPAIKAAIDGCSLLFLNSSPSFTDTGAETRQALNILHAAKLAGVKHVVYSSAIHVNHPKDQAHLPPESFLANYFRSKLAIEEEVRSGKWALGWTILRGSSFMTNWLLPHAQIMYPDLVAKGIITTAFTAETKLWLLDPDDIGRFVAAIFMGQERFNGKDIDLAVQALSIEEIAERLAKVAEKKVGVRFWTEEEIADQKDTNVFIPSQLLLRNMGNWVDLEDVKKWGVPLRTFEDFLASNKERVKDTVDNSK